MTRVDLDELNRGLRLPEPQLHGDAGALLRLMEKILEAHALPTSTLLEVLAILGYRLVAKDVVGALEEALRGILDAMPDGRGRWRLPDEDALPARVLEVAS